VPSSGGGDPGNTDPGLRACELRACRKGLIVDACAARVSARVPPIVFLLVITLLSDIKKSSHGERDLLYSHSPSLVAGSLMTDSSIFCRSSVRSGSDSHQLLWRNDRHVVIAREIVRIEGDEMCDAVHVHGRHEPGIRYGSPRDCVRQNHAVPFTIRRGAIE
jgi:hypothetical protein